MDEHNCIITSAYYISAQSNHGESSGHVACMVVMRNPHGDFIWKFEDMTLLGRHV